MTVKLVCEGCDAVHEFVRPGHMPDEANHIRCNWCYLCEDTAEDYYDEWFSEDVLPDAIDPNQLALKL